MHRHGGRADVEHQVLGQRVGGRHPETHVEHGGGTPGAGREQHVAPGDLARPYPTQVRRDPAYRRDALARLLQRLQ